MHLMDSSDSHCLFTWLWKCASRIRHKIFFRLALYDRVNTRGLLKRKTFHINSYSCGMCNENCEESIQHLVWDCTFAQHCWSLISPDKKRGISLFGEVVLLHALFQKNSHGRDAGTYGCKEMENSFRMKYQVQPLGISSLNKIYIWSSIGPKQRMWKLSLRGLIP